MNSTTERTEPRAADGLTKTERATLRDPASYVIQERNPCRFLVSSRECFADFEVVIGYGRWVRMVSNTGTTLDLTIGEECPCLDALHRGGDCKHMTVLGVVLEHRATEADRRSRVLEGRLMALTEWEARQIETDCYTEGESLEEIEMTHWTELDVYDAESARWGTLEEMVNTSPVDLSGAEIQHGQITAWHGYFIAAPGEDPNWDTPRGEVDWTGFTQSLAAAEGNL